VAVLRLRTLGGISLERDTVTLDAVGAQRKALALLTLLGVSRGQGISRDRVAAYLWPESDTERARGALKQTLHVIRRQLGSPEIILGTSELRLNPSYIASDVDAFLSALEEGEHELAAQLYGGPFLDGFHVAGAPEFEEWVSVQREEFARRYASALERVASAAEARADPVAAIEWLRRLQTTDPFSARVTLWLMRALDAAGERVAALRCAQTHETLLREELDSPPDPEVAALAGRLREEPVRPSPPPVAVDPQPFGSVPPEELVPTATGPGRAPDSVRPEAPVQAMRPRRSTIVLVAFIAAALAVAIFVTDRRASPGGAASNRAADRSVAVLPFENVSGDPATSHLSDGLTEELTSALSSVQGLRVAPRASTTALQQRGFGWRAIADSLDVASVVEGSVHPSGDRLKVNVTLVRARDRMVLWAETYDREMHELLAVQEEIARAVADALYPQRTASPDAALVGPRTSNPVAYELYLRARHSWRQRSREGLQQAVVYYEEAIEHDPTFAMAFVGLADTYVNLSNFGYREGGEAHARAEVAANRAVTLAPQLAEAHASRGFVLASTQDFGGAEAAFKRAIELNPSYSWTHHYYTLLLMMLGRMEEALEHNRHALAADPLSLPANATHGIILLHRGDYPAADRQLQRALTLSPNFQLTQYYLAVLRAVQGRYEDATRLLEQTAIQAPNFTGVPGARVLVLQRTGRMPAADSLLAYLEAQAGTGDERTRMNLAFAYAVLGRMDAAFALFDQVGWDVPALVVLRTDPLLQALRADPRYPSLLQRIGADR
jgi:adenylate cyclase